ncbi:MAG: class I SAM-dependent methyltransferase [Prosthecobacter sp.]
MSFDRLAPHYRWIEALFAGERLQSCRTAMLDAIAPPQNVLIYGEGNGRFLVELLRRFPLTRVTVVEASTVMVELAKTRLIREGLESVEVTFLQGDALTWEPPASSFDLIVTCFFLDCFREDQLLQLIPRITNASTAEARWVVADFQIATSGLRRLFSRVMVALLYAFFRRVTHLPGHKLVDPAPLLRTADFVCVQREVRDFGILYSALWKRAETASQTRRIT